MNESALWANQESQYRNPGLPPAGVVGELVGRVGEHLEGLDQRGIAALRSVAERRQLPGERDDGLDERRDLLERQQRRALEQRLRVAQRRRELARRRQQRGRGRAERVGEAGDVRQRRARRRQRPRQPLDRLRSATFWLASAWIVLSPACTAVWSWPSFWAAAWLSTPRLWTICESSPRRAASRSPIWRICAAVGPRLCSSARMSLPRPSVPLLSSVTRLVNHARVSVSSESSRSSESTGTVVCADADRRRRARARRPTRGRARC